MKQQQKNKNPHKHTPTKHTHPQKTCKIISNEKGKMPLILLQGEMEKVNTSNGKMKEMNETEVVNDKGLIRDKTVDRPKRVKLKQWSG